MKTIIHITLFFGLMTLVRAELPKQDHFQKEIGRMLKGLYINDSKTVIRHLHPAVIESGGGRVGWEKIVSDSTKRFNSAGLKYFSSTVLEMKNYAQNDKYECFLAYVNLVIKKREGYVSAITKQLAVRQKGSDVWYYFDVTSKDIETIKKLVPDLPKEVSLK